MILPAVGVLLTVVEVIDLIEVLLGVALVEHASPLPETSSKLAHVMRVLLAKWTTKERLPKNEPGPSTIEVNGST